MAETKSPQSKPITVEDLLRLKRHEKPSAGFWNDFDRELHQRTLQAFVRRDSTGFAQFWQLIGRRLAWATPALAMLVLAQGVSSWRPSPSSPAGSLRRADLGPSAAPGATGEAVAHAPLSEWVSDRGGARFVTDALSSASGEEGFLRLHNALRATPDTLAVQDRSGGPVYVADDLSRGSRESSGTMRPGGVLLF